METFPIPLLPEYVGDREAHAASRAHARALLDAWCLEVADATRSSDGEVPRFPFDAAISIWQERGKAAVEPAVCTSLAAAIGHAPGSGMSHAQPLLAPFVTSLLDVTRGTYGYDSYLALPVVAGDLISATAPLPEQLNRCLLRLSLICVDLVRMEAEALLGTADRLTTNHPSRLEVVRRLRAAAAAVVDFRNDAGAEPLGELEAVGARARAGEIDESTLTEIAVTARRWSETYPEEERLRVRLSLLPMSASHDENAFIRVLQTFEILFLPVRRALELALEALPGDPARALEALGTLPRTMRRSDRLFRILTTMNRERFMSFRSLTHGSSAIQSRQYKLIEAMCSRPSAQRVGSLAFACLAPDELSTTTLDEFVEQLDPGPLRAAIVRELRTFEREFLKWKRVHWRVALRMIGELPGTGGTEGASYLHATVDTPLFPRLGTARRA